MFTKFDTRKTIAHVVWWGGLVGLLLLSQTRVEALLYLFQETWISSFFDPVLLEKNATTIITIVTPVRGIILLFSLIILAYPIIQNIRQSDVILNSKIKSKHVLQAVFLFFILCIIFTPGGINGLAQEYSNTSLVMFTRASSVSYHQRFLMTAIANILFFRGDFFFLVFSFICTLVFIFVLRLWFETNQVSVSFWQLVSLGTISFVYFQIRVPGYPDVLANIFILLAFVFKLDTKAKLSLFVLSLASHEASLIIWFALAFLLFDVKGYMQFLAICGIYLFLLFSFNDGIYGVLAAREVGETSNLMWVVNYPWREVLGVAISFKALWGIVIAAVWYLFSRKNYREAFQILIILLAGILMTFMGVDTSRLFGWTFMAVLISWKILKNSENNWEKIINITLIVNLLIPSVDVFLIMNPYIAPGLYQYIFHSLFGV